ncbi:SWIM zinc finger family protein [Sphaerisporangium siamense]|uniref:Putative Zn finger protein n=1 Tax=Sphaerisporangium siamense TaxID=795645 RepID=A0A7W7GD07_9ACTN|nr:SWIM zinc finger family protein [Sphaerisporangium siamense]MBB4702521.1 putative Zn finger protein [Sphaerisporangium siamense]
MQAENVSGEPYRPHTVTARVEGHSAKYIVLLDDGRWTCTCDDPATCAHVAAVQLVTGHPGPARKEQR